jgi:hypothetical protein
MREVSPSLTQRRELTEAQDAMLEHFAYLNYSEHRPASWQDFSCFEVNNKQYKLKHGTIKNHFSYLKRVGKIKLEYKDINSYYSLVECAMTPYHTRVTAPNNRVVKRDLAALIDRMPFDKSAVHNIRLCFCCCSSSNDGGLWDRLRVRQQDDDATTVAQSSNNMTSQHQQQQQLQLSMTVQSKDLAVPIMRLDAGVKAYITVHKTNTVSIILKCSETPFKLDPAGLLILNRSLVRIQEHLRAMTFNLIDIPDPDTWIITMWHFARDSLERYEGEKFHITLGDFNGELLRVYSKKGHLRAEEQETFSPDTRLRDAIKKKLSVGRGV